MNKTYKVDVVVKYFYPVAAGIETNVLETYSRLAKQGWDITIHTTRDKHKEKNVLPIHSKIKGIKVIRYESGIFKYTPEIDWKESDFVCLHNFDIFPHFYIFLKALIDKIARRKKYALFVTPHGGFNPDWKSFSLLKIIIKSIYHFIAGIVIINYVVDGVRAVSIWEKERMMAWGIRKNKIKVISNGLEDEAYLDPTNKVTKKIKKLTDRSKPYIIQVGRINKIKNFETTVKALAILPKELKFVIVGPVQDPVYKAKLDKLIIELELLKRVIFAGVIRGTDKYYLIRNSEAMVHMALWEANCNVVHEAMSQEKMCFVSNRAGLKCQICSRKNGFSFKARDVKGLTRELSIYLEDKSNKKYLAMTNKNLKYVKNHSWEKVSERMGNFYLKRKI